MNNKLKDLFNNKAKNILSVYLTAGYPKLDSTTELCMALEKAGVDLLEIGIPFSDSLVDGPTIQVANEQALKNGMRLSLLFEQLEELKDKVKLPLVLMGCLNPIEQYGIEEFCKKAASLGIAGAIIPDLPPEIFEREYKELFEKYNLAMIFLVTQHSTDERIKYLDSLSSGFLYAVSSDAITGGDLESDKRRDSYLERLDNLNLKNPILLGFGISSKESLAYAQKHCAGGIIGSAFIRALDKGGSSKLEDLVGNFVLSVRA